MTSAFAFIQSFGAYRSNIFPGSVLVSFRHPFTLCYADSIFVDGLLFIVQSHECLHPASPTVAHSWSSGLSPPPLPSVDEKHRCAHFMADYTALLDFSSIIQ